MLVTPSNGNFNPRSPCGERQQHARRDARCFHFNPRSPCGERRVWSLPSGYAAQFQSTLPMRGATPDGVPLIVSRSYFNPRSPCGERRWQALLMPSCVHFNPRSPCGERRSPIACMSASAAYFNPRSPCGERLGTFISSIAANMDFNPRSPCGERHHPHYLHIFIHIFQSTLPMRGATTAGNDITVCG